MRKFKSTIALMLVFTMIVSLFSNPYLAKATSDNSFKVGSMTISASESPDLSQHLNLFKEHQLDVVGIQGLDNNTSRNQYNMLDAFKGDAYPYTSFQKAFDFAGGAYGNGIISNMEIKNSNGSPFTMVSNEEPRAWQKITIEVNEKNVSVYNVFLAYETKEINLAQIRELISIMEADATEYKVLLGNFNIKDFNANINEFSEKYRLAHGKDGNWVGDVRNNIITTKNIKVSDVKESTETYNAYKLLSATCELFDEEIEDDPVDAPENPNLALNKTVSVSSQEVDYTFFDYWAVDGDPTTRWSPGYADEEWLQVDLGEVKEIQEIYLNLYAEGPEYKVLISTNGQDYETVAYITDGSSTNNVQKTFIFDTPKQARYVKYLQMQKRSPDVDGNRWPTSVSELEVYAKARNVENDENAPTTESVMIGSFNIASGEDPDISQMIEVLEENGIDYVGVQEVDKNTSRNPKDVLATFSATGTYANYSFQKAMDFAGGQYGIGIISKTQLKATDGGNLEVRAEDEPRAWQKVLVEVDGKKIAIYNTHLSFETVSATNNQIEYLISIMNEDPTEYKVLTGDFNISESKEQIYPFLLDYNITNGKDGVWYDTFNGPSDSNNIAIDNIITTRNMKVKDVQMVDTSALTDHNLFFAEFELLEEEEVSTEYLDILKDKANDLDPSIYTETSYAAVESALNDANALGEDASQTQINEVVNALKDALDGLVVYSANPNLALNKAVTSSSQEVDYTFFDYWAVDGDATTRWSPGYADEEWLQVDLGEVKSIQEIHLNLYAEGPEYKVLISTNGQDYETVAYITDGSSTNNVQKTFTFDTPKQARYVKYLQMQKRVPDSAGDRWPTSISELEVYGKPYYGTVTPDPNVNLALNKAVTSSSQEVDYTFFDYWTVDGDLTTRWSPGFSDEEWLQVNLGAVYNVGLIKLYFFQEAPTYKVLISEDGITYEEVLYATDGCGDENVKVIRLEEKQARYVKYLQMEQCWVEVDQAYYGSSLYELEVYTSSEEIETAQNCLEMIENNAPTISDDGTKLVLPEIESELYEAAIYGSSNEAVIALDGTIHQPLEDMTVTLLYKVSNVNDENDVAIADDDVTIVIPGKYSQEANDNAKPDVLPGIREWKGNTGSFTLTNDSKIVIADESLRDVAQKISFYFAEMLGRIVPISTETATTGDIYLSFTDHKELGDEGYFVEIADMIKVEAYAETGVLYAGTTLTQMFQQDAEYDQVPKGFIRDYPQYKTRSMMIDVARFFMPIDYLEEITKYMAYYKFNEIHVHINDDEGEPDYNGAQYNSAFRLESKKYPEINQGGEYYTQDEYRAYQKEVAKYGVKVVTEIDTPAHSGFARFHNPSLMLEGYYMDVTNPEVLEFTKSLLDEFLDGDDPVIQSDEFHIGTDEYFVSVDTGDAFARYMEELMAHVKAKGYKTRFWSNNHINGYALDNDATVDMWAHGIYGDYEYFIDNGFKLINLDMNKLYCVPGFDYGTMFTDYYDVEYLYDTFEVQQLSDGTIISLASPQLLGGSIALWNDYKEGFSQFDIFDRLRDGIVLTAEKNWYGVATAGQTGEDFVARVAKVDNGSAPGCNPARYVASNDEVVAAYDFEEVSESIIKDTTVNGYDATINGLDTVTIDEDSFVAFNGQGSITLPFDSIGYPYTVEFDIYIDESTPENAVLFDGKDGTLYLNYDGTGKIGFERKGYRYLIDCEYELNKWQHVVITCNEAETKLSIDGKVSVAEYYQTEARRLKSSTFILPVEEIGKGVVGYFDNLVIDDEVIVLESENLALNKDVTSSSHEVDFTFFDYWVVDGDPTTRWSPGFSDEEWVEVDLGAVYNVGQIVLNIFQEAPTYKVLISEDGETYEEVLHVTDGACSEVIKTVDLEGKQARFVKYLQMEQCWIESDQAYYGSSLYELEVYEQSTSSEVEEVDATALKEAIAAAEAIDLSTYTEESKAALLAKVADAKVTLIRKGLTQAMVNEMVQAVEDAMNALETLPQKVENVIVTATNYKTIALTWDAYKDAKNYVVERLANDGEWIEVSTTSEPTYTHVGVKTGKTYTYRIKANNSEYSETVSATAMLEGEVELTLANNGTTKFDLTWTTVEGATRYIIYRKKNDGEWKKVLTLGKDVTTYTSKGMSEGTYTYQVKAARYDSVDRVMTNGSNEVVGMIGKVNPTLTITEENGTSVTLAWNKVPCMKYYDVYRAKDGGVYRQVKRTTDTTMISTSLKAGSTYTYKVRAFNLSNDTKVYTDFSNEVSYFVQ